MYLTWLDNNSWLIEMGGQRILLDPWLVGPLVFNNWPWLFQGKHGSPRSIPDNIDLILLSQGLEDHAHPETLKQLDRQIPVVASPNAAKVVQELGYTQITPLHHGEKFTLADAVEILAVPGDSIGPFLVENGYVLTDVAAKTTLYYDPHGHHSPSLAELAPIDAIITPVITLKLPLAGSIIKGGESALQAVKWLRPQVILPTAAGGEVEYAGVLAALIQQDGSIEQFRTLLAQNKLSTQVLTPKPDERVELELTTVDR